MIKGWPDRSSVWCRQHRNGDRTKRAAGGWVFLTGRWPGVGVLIDHQDGNRQNNAAANLRKTDAQGNARNLAISSANTSGVVGVSWHKPFGMWQAKVTVDRPEGDNRTRQQHLGFYDVFAEACTVRRQAERICGYHENHGQRRSAAALDADLQALMKQYRKPKTRKQKAPR